MSVDPMQQAERALLVHRHGYRWRHLRIGQSPSEPECIATYRCTGKSQPARQAKRSGAERRTIAHNGRVKAPQAPRYTTMSRLQSAQTLDDAF